MDYQSLTNRVTLPQDHNAPAGCRQFDGRYGLFGDVIAMRVVEISQPLLEMAFTRQIVEQKFRAREETINEHLVKLLAFEVAEPTQAVWKKELKNHLSYLAKIRIKTQGLVPERFVRNWLYADPFDENEAPYVSGFIEMHADDYVRNEKAPQAIADRIKEFWEDAAPAIATGSSPRDLVDRL